MKPPFIIYGLPRSRTYWLSRFLSYGDWHCGHEEVRHARSLDDVRAWFKQPCTGTVETAGAPFWRLVREIAPEAVTVVVRRSVPDAIASLKKLLVQFDDKRLHVEMAYLNRKLDQIEARVPGVVSVQFDDLSDEATCARLFEHCLPYRHDPTWFACCAPLNMQVNVRALLRYYEAHRPGMDKLRQTAKAHQLAQMARPVVAPDGMTIQQEPFEDFLRDGARLFVEHSEVVGEAAESFTQKNIPVMRALEAMGCLQVTTARSNGRMFGYLMAVISPSLEARNYLTSVHTTFFASADAPGIGIRLQRASIEALRARGVQQVDFRAGVRGSGPRMGALYRRMGAERAGEMYTLKMGVG